MKVEVAQLELMYEVVVVKRMVMLLQEERKQSLQKINEADG